MYSSNIIYKKTPSFVSPIIILSLDKLMFVPLPLASKVISRQSFQLRAVEPVVSKAANFINFTQKYSTSNADVT